MEDIKQSLSDMRAKLATHVAKLKDELVQTQQLLKEIDLVLNINKRIEAKTKYVKRDYKKTDAKKKADIDNMIIDIIRSNKTDRLTLVELIELLYEHQNISIGNYQMNKILKKLVDNNRLSYNKVGYRYVYFLPSK